jgi:hypothetical protein
MGMSRSSHGAFAEVAPRTGRWLTVALALGSLAILVGLSAGSSSASVAKTKVVLGQTSTVPDPSCPGSPCQAIGSVTGFQISSDQAQSPFLVPHDGTIKAWTLTLAQPTDKQRSFFNGFFGTPPEARLSIIRRVPGTNPPRYTLRSQGSIKVLSPYFGRTVEFGSSLEVEKNDIVAITVPTWAPAFSEGLSAKNVWRASREPGACADSTAIRQGEPQQKVGRRATYGCRYSTARLLYTATLVEG